MSISGYKETPSVLETGDIHKINLVFNRTNHSLVNAIRRVLMAEIPVAAFDDTYHDDVDENSIQIAKNISGIHNEFISHRLSLQPLCMYRNDSLKVSLGYDRSKAILTYNFANPDAVPIFDINVTNDLESKTKYQLNADNSLDVMGNMITIRDQEDFNNVSDFIIPDYTTGGYCLLHRLKQNVYGIDAEGSETLQVSMRPTIGTGQVHARYNPTGTVSYEFVKDSQERLDTNFDNYMKNLQDKRKEDGLAPFNDEDIRIFRDTFDVMGSERVYKKTSDGEPEQIKMCVESIGNLSPQQLIYDAISMIKIRTYAILNQFEWNETEKRYDYGSEKISIQKNIEGDYYQMTIQNEDHTIGNIIGSYLKQLFIRNSKFGNLLTMGSYKLPHPLQKKIVVSMKLNEDLDTRVLFAKSGLKTTSNPETIIIQLLMVTMSVYLNDLDKILSQFSEVSGINETSFEIEDDILTKSYFNRSSQLAIFLN